MSRIWFPALGLVAAVMLPAEVVQATSTWNFDIPPPGSAPCVQSQVVQGSGTSAVYPWGNSVVCTPVQGGAPTVTATAWSNSSGTVSNTAGATRIENAYIHVFGGGLGVTNRLVNTSADGTEGTSPEHAIDNNGLMSNSSGVYRNNGTSWTSSNPQDVDHGRYDMVLLTFSSAVNLTGLTIGWGHTDVDVTVMALDPTSATPTPNLTNQTYGALTGFGSATNLGWDLVGHYANAPFNNTVLDLRTSRSTSDIITSNTSIQSRYWLIGAYNPTVGTDGRTPQSLLTAGNDYFKLFSVIGTASSPPAPGGVPEPATLALFAMAALGARHASRRGRR